MSYTNKIIAISGEPVSGKGTVIRELRKQLLKKGYKEENIHVISTGHKFREFFEVILDFIKNNENEEKLKEISAKPPMDEILANPQYREKITKTIARIKNEKIKLDDIDSISDANNSEVLKDIRDMIDYLIDTGSKKMGDEIAEKESKDEIWIFDSRMAFANIHEAFSIRLTTNSREAGKRLFNDKTRGKEDRYSSVEEAEKAREERRIGEIKRYKERYGVDLENPDNYDLIIDTSYADVKDIADVILLCGKRRDEGGYFGKTWASPLTMLPSQTMQETWDPSPGYGLKLLEIVNKIKENGYYPDREIQIFRMDGVNYILEGHHRNFASIFAGKTLIPYIDEMTTEEGRKRAERGWIPTCTKKFLFDHEFLVERGLRVAKNDNKIKFSYSDIYPDILDRIEDPTKKGEDR